MSNTLLRSHREISATELSSRPCCVVAPISPTKISDPAKHRDNSDANASDMHEPNGSGTLDATNPVVGPARDTGTPDTFSSYSSLDSNDIHVSSSECGSSTCSESNSDTSLTDKRKSKLSTPVKPMTEEEFRDLLTSPIVTPLHEDVRMLRGGAGQSLVTDGSVVQEYEPSVVDSCHDKIYGGYHDIVPSLQPYTKPIIYSSKD